MHKMLRILCIQQYRSAFPPGHDQQHKTPSDRNNAQDRREWERLGFFRGHLKRSNVDHFFPCRVGDALIAEGSYTNDDKQDCNNDQWSHFIIPLMIVYVYAVNICRHTFGDVKHLCAFETLSS